jgi:NAD(P)-dependent dehydrogenase (short-subunit alcohol dehydrogenase family)
MLYQATLPLLPKGGKFVVVGSRAGVLSIPKVVPAGAYGQSKAAVHFLVCIPNATGTRLTGVDQTTAL